MKTVGDELTAPLDESIKTIVALFAFAEYAADERERTRLESMPHSAAQHARLRALFTSPRYRNEGFHVLELEPCRDRGDVLARLTHVGRLARSHPDLSVVLVWSSHGGTFSRDLHLATPDCTDLQDGLLAKQVITFSGAKTAAHYCVFIDACEAAGSVLEFSQVAASREWDADDRARSFAAFYASHPFANAKDGVYLSLLAQILELGPSKKAEAKARESWGNFGFSDKDRFLSAEDIAQGIHAELLANPARAMGVRVPAPTMFGSQYLFPNPRYVTNAPARMVDRDALDTHFLSKARGIEIGETSWHFAGRVDATRAILGWATAARDDASRVFILTGEGGTGKSALLGRLIALADPFTRERLRSEGWSEAEDRAQGTLPPPGLFDAALHLRNLTAQSTIKQLAELLGFEPPESPETFVDVVVTSGNGHKLIAVDALDEAEDPQAVVLRVLAPLATLGWRVLVATRGSSQARGAQDLIALLRPVCGDPYNLDTDQHSEEDIARYVVNRIRATPSPQFADNPALVEQAGLKVAVGAKGKFLYARIATSNLLRCVDEITEETLGGLLGADIGGVFEQDLRLLDRAFQDRFKRKDRGATLLLEALAWAQGSGLPARDGLWATMAAALHGKAGPIGAFEDSHVHWVMREAGRYVLEDGDGSQAVYRLFHQSLVDHFRARREGQADIARTVAAALARRVKEMGGWQHANPYLVRHMAAHWSACRPQSELHTLLTEFEWMRARLDLTGIRALVLDYEYADNPVPEAVARLNRTLSMVSHILAKDSRQLIPQLIGRLAPSDEATCRLCEAARQGIDRPTWLPRLGGLSRAGALVLVMDPGDSIESLAFSPDGTRIASVATTLIDGTIRLWDAHSGQMLGEPLRVRDVGVSCLALSTDGTRIVTGSHDGTVRLWDAQSGQILGEPLRVHDAIVSCIALSSDGTRIVTGSCDGTVRLWDAHSGQMLGEPLRRHAQEVLCVGISPDGTRGVSGGIDGIVSLWDAHSGQMLGEPRCVHDGGVTCVAFSPEGTRVVSGGIDRTLYLWHAHSGWMLGESLCKHDPTATCLGFSLDGTRVISGSSENVRLWDAQSGQMLGELLRWHSDSGAGGRKAFSQDGTRLVSGDDGYVRLWDLYSGQVLGEPLRGHDRMINCVAFSQDGTRVVSHSDYGVVRIWDARSGRMMGELLSDPYVFTIKCVALSPDGTRVASGCIGGFVCLWDAHTGGLLGEPQQLHLDDVASVTFSPDGTHVVSGADDGTVRLWDPHGGQALGDPLVHGYGVASVAFSLDGTRLISGGGRDARLWDVQSRQLLCKWYLHRCEVTSVAFCPDRKRVALGTSDGTVRLWDARIGQRLGKPLRVHEGKVASVNFSPDGTRVVSSGYDRTVRLWDVHSGRTLAIVHGDELPLSCAVNPAAASLQVVTSLSHGLLTYLDLVTPSDHSRDTTST